MCSLLGATTAGGVLEFCAGMAVEALTVEIDGSRAACDRGFNGGGALRVMTANAIAPATTTTDAATMTIVRRDM
ncbi:MAG TPA: hypothetical protein VGG74_34460 [Kofleriaceae bacterium]